MQSLYLCGLLWPTKVDREWRRIDELIPLRITGRNIPRGVSLIETLCSCGCGIWFVQSRVNNSIRNCIAGHPIKGMPKLKYVQEKKKTIPVLVEVYK